MFFPTVSGDCLLDLEPIPSGLFYFCYFIPAVFRNLHVLKYAQFLRAGRSDWLRQLRLMRGFFIFSKRAYKKSRWEAFRRSFRSSLLASLRSQVLPKKTENSRS